MSPSATSVLPSLGINTEDTALLLGTVHKENNRNNYFLSFWQAYSRISINFSLYCNHPILFSFIRLSLKGFVSAPTVVNSQKMPVRCR